MHPSLSPPAHVLRSCFASSWAAHRPCSLQSNASATEIFSTAAFTNKVKTTKTPPWRPTPGRLLTPADVRTTLASFPSGRKTGARHRRAHQLELLPEHMNPRPARVPPSVS